MTQKADRQRARRMAARQCGNCGEPATEMKSWAGQTIPVCGQCLSRLNSPAPQTPYCSLYEVRPDMLMPSALCPVIRESEDDGLGYDGEPEYDDWPECDDELEYDGEPEYGARSGNFLRKIWDWVMED